MEAVEGVLGDQLVAVYLYGSAVVGGLRPASDLDLFAVVSRPTSYAERRDLASTLIPISRREVRPPAWRPLELTVVATPDLVPWRFPPRTDFQYGEWLRDEFERGEVDPDKPDNPDLALVIEMVRRNGRRLVGPPADELLPPVPEDDLRAALVGVVPDLMADLDPDTANVLLTLARVWHTLESGEFTSKDAAADWAITRLGSTGSRPLVKARDTYLGAATDGSWDVHAVHELADRLVAEIQQYDRR